MEYRDPCWYNLNLNLPKDDNEYSTNLLEYKSNHSAFLNFHSYNSWEWMKLCISADIFALYLVNQFSKCCNTNMASKQDSKGEGGILHQQ